MAAIASAALLGVAACSSASSSTANATGGTSASSKLPASVRSAGEITIATSGGLVPDAYMASNGTTVIGFIPDLFADMAKMLGTKVSWIQVDVADELSGISAGRYDAAVFLPATTASLQVNNYMTFAVESYTLDVLSSYSGSVSSLCGKPVGSGAGPSTTATVKDLSAWCTSHGYQALQAQVYPTQPDGVVALQSGRIDAVITGAESAESIAATSGGKIKVLPGGLPAGVGTKTDEGIAFAKTSAGLQLAKALQGACQTLINSGTYEKILKKWHGDAVSTKKCLVNTPYGQ